jgi:23S rRNA (uracil1939-C5)-methyltransferase
MPETVFIEKLVFGGNGLARTPDGIVFVNHVIPGETVAITKTGKKGGQAVARTLEIITQSPDRREPPCPLAGICGGCNWQHIVYSRQLAIKEEIYRECMQRIGRISELPPIETISGQEFGYRHRAQIKVDNSGSAGFFARETNNIVPVPRCPLLTEAINSLLDDIFKQRIKLPGMEKDLRIMAGDAETLASSPIIAGRSAKSVMITAGANRFEVRADSFFQSNRLLLEKLGTWAAPYVGGRRCVDLYGGSGFFSIMLGDRFEKALLIESADTHVAEALENYRRNGLAHFEAKKGNAEDFAGMIGSEKIDCLITDPPRTGMTNGVLRGIAGKGSVCVVRSGHAGA